MISKITNSILHGKYKINDFPFDKMILDHFKKFNVRDLKKIHVDLPNELKPRKVVSVKNDQDQSIYKYLYKIDKGFNLKKKEGNGKFLDLYYKFVNKIAKEFFSEDLVFQSKPTFRVHFPDNLAVGGFHRDREYNHPLEEINIWVPLTETSDTSSIWIESSFDKKDYKPMNLKYGDFIIFDSGLQHGNKINLTNKTRISFDFRVIPSSKYKKNDVVKKSTGQFIKFKIGDYYSVTSNI